MSPCRRHTGWPARRSPQRDRKRDVPWRSPVLPPIRPRTLCLVDAILYPLYAHLACTVGATVEGAICLYPMAQNPTATMAASGRQGMDGTLKAIKSMPWTSRHHLKGLVIVIAAGCASSHGYTPLCMRLFTACLPVASTHMCVLPAPRYASGGAALILPSTDFGSRSTARSPSDTIPTAFPPSSTGKRRMAWSRISRTACSMLSVGVTVSKE
jgi:hypothetical protein